MAAYLRLLLPIAAKESRHEQRDIVLPTCGPLLTEEVLDGGQEPYIPDLQAGFFEDFSLRAFLERLPELEMPAGETV